MTRGEAEAIRPALLALDECPDPECQKARGIYRAARTAIEESHGIP